MKRIITEEWLKEKKACSPGLKYAKENNWLGLTLEQSIDLLLWADKINDAGWLLTRCMTKAQCVKYAIFAAEQAIDIFEKKHPNDTRPRKAIETAKAWITIPCKENTNKCYSSTSAAYSAAYSSASAAAYPPASASASAASAASAAASAAYASYYAAAAAADKYDIKIAIIEAGIRIIRRKI